jgi:Transposase
MSDLQPGKRLGVLQTTIIGENAKFLAFCNLASSILLSSISYLMPPRTPLGVISGNARKPIDLTPFQRGQISGKANAGQTAPEISKNLKIPDSTVRRTLTLQPQRPDRKSLPKSGRHRISAVLDVRNILRLVRATPKITYKKIRKELDITFLSDTLKRILERKGIKNWRCKRRPFLTPEVVYKLLRAADR